MPRSSRLSPFPVCLPAAGCCSSTPKTPHGKPLMKDGRYSSSYDAFVADPQYRFTRDIWYHDERIRQAQARNSKIVIHLKDQRGVLWVNGQPAMNFPCALADPPMRRPRQVSIIQKDADYRSPGPMAMFDASGLCVDSDAPLLPRVPSGGKFIGAKMPLVHSRRDRAACGHGVPGTPIPMGASGCLWRRAAFCLTNAAWEQP